MGDVKIFDRGSGPELERIRISVYDVVPYLEAGDHPEYIASVLPITVAEVHALRRYVEDHRVAVMAVHRQIEERNARGNPPELEERLRNLPNHQRLMARWEEAKAKRRIELNGCNCVSYKFFKNTAFFKFVQNVNSEKPRDYCKL